eukprot:6212811-Pleurochrysis_carterae.AAC.1
MTERWAGDGQGRAPAARRENVRRIQCMGAEALRHGSATAAEAAGGTLGLWHRGHRASSGQSSDSWRLGVDGRDHRAGRSRGASGAPHRAPGGTWAHGS